MASRQCGPGQTLSPNTTGAPPVETRAQLDLIPKYGTIAMGKHDKTLAAVFAEPTRTNVKWSDVEALMKSRGAEITEGSGSRVRVVLNGVRATFHRPHPQPDADRGALKSVRKFLSEVGVTP